jgi:hypothetical protein
MREPMKIISVDNFDREQPGVSNDKLIADHVDSYYVDTIVAALNGVYCATGNEDRFFKAVSDDYQLRTYEP